MLYDYIISNYKEGEPIFFSDIFIEGISRSAVNQQMKSLCNKGLIKKYDKGIYYIPKKTMLKATVGPSADMVARYRFVTKGEEIFNMVTHIVGGAMGIAALVLCIIFCHDGYGLFSGIVYGISMILLYTMSAIYHGLSPKLKAKKVFQIMDHCSIFVLIAGTYTPVLLCSIREVDAKWAWILFAVIWIMTVIGITLNAIDIKKYQTFSMICYLVMGWCIIFKINLLPQAVGMNGIWLLVSGGLAYTIGVIFYVLQNKIKYMHSIWHLWILVGSILHFLCIILYVL